jgi:hypothetical protein
VLVVLVNGEAQLEYDRGKALPESQLHYLERMDQQMDAGVRLGSDWIERPDRMQRAEFVAVHLLDALQEGNEALAAASCAYLAERLPDLKQVRAKRLGAGFSIELVFDKPYVAENPISFIPRQGS